MCSLFGFRNKKLAYAYCTLGVKFTLPGGRSASGRNRRRVGAVCYISNAQKPLR